VRVLIVHDGRSGRAAEAAGRLAGFVAGHAAVETATLEDCDATACDVAVVVGGDGTMLGAVQALAGREVPLIGVNVGRLGFLTEFSEEEFRGGLPALLTAKPSARMTLEVRCGGGTASRLALNEAMLVRCGPPRICHLSLHIDGRFVTTYAGDGVLVATPTGSTAYSLSAGGPILAPGTDALLVTPLNPHTLTNRPLVLPGGARLEIEVVDSRTDMLLSVDGRGETRLDAGVRVEIRRGGKRVLIVEKEPFFDTLKEKLRWGGLPNYGEGTDRDR